MLTYVDLARRSKVSTSTLYTSFEMNATLTCSATAVNLQNRFASISRYHKVSEAPAVSFCCLGSIPALLRRCSKAASLRIQRQLTCRTKASFKDQVKPDRCMPSALVELFCLHGGMLANMQAVHAFSRREAALAGLGALLLSPAAAQAGLLGGGPDKNEVYTQDTVSTYADD